MPAVAAALVAWAVAFGLLAVWSQAAGALLMLAVAGAARSLFDVAGRTLLQRTAPSDVLARVFGILEALIMAGTAVGALVAPLLVNLAGATAGIIGVGAVLPVLALLGGRRLWALDASARVPIVELGLLRSLDLFSALPPPELEGLAQKLEPLSVSAGEVVVTQGEQGDRYYAIADGELEVVQDDRLLNLLGRGEGFGEIALLHGVRRTATVRAVTDAHLYALEQEPFLLVLEPPPAQPCRGRGDRGRAPGDDVAPLAGAPLSRRAGERRRCRRHAARRAAASGRRDTTR